MRDVSGFGIASRPQLDKGLSENNIGFTERVFSAAGAAVLSAVTLNPLDVVKTRLQAQAAGMSYSHPLSNSIGRMAFFGPNMMFADLRCSPSCARAGVEGTVSICPPDCFQYKGTFDVFTKIIRQVGIYLPFYDMFRNRLEELSREKAPAMTFCVPTVAGSLARSLACTVCYPIDLARTRMQAFKEAKAGVKPPGVFKTLVGVFSEVRTANNLESSLHNYRGLWRGLGAQLARDVPFSAICWSTLEPIKKRLLGVAGNDTNLVGVFGATFSAGFIAGSIAAAATCPLDVARTRRQIEGWRDERTVHGNGSTSGTCRTIGCLLNLDSYHQKVSMRAFSNMKSKTHYYDFLNCNLRRRRCVKRHSYCPALVMNYKSSFVEN
ncbi:putative protein [Arabidopsis thaliana]|nr:putative protein [Arabidopsis thaliana]CAB79596.1 putative protein [Arabidopsis thaliana]